MSRIGSSLLAVAVLISLPAAAYRLPPDRVVRLGDGDDAALAEANCAACHSLEYITSQPPAMGPAFWTAEVTKMRSVYGAGIDDETAKRIVAFLAERKSG